MIREIYEKVKQVLQLSEYNEIVILIPPNLNESKIFKKGLMLFRVDSPNGVDGFRHVHVSRTDSPVKKIAYNIDGTRHDSHKFCNNFPGLKNAQELIRKEFKLSDDFMFEVVGAINGSTLMLKINE